MPFLASFKTTTRNILDAIRRCSHWGFLVLGFACLFLWTWLMLQDSGFYMECRPFREVPLIHPWSLAMAMFVVTFVLFGVFSRFLELRFRSRRALGLLFAAMVVGLTCIIAAHFLVLPGRAGVVLSLAGAFLLGLVTPFYYLEFVRLLLKLSLAQIIAICAAATLLASVVYFLALVASGDVLVFLPALLLFGMTVSIWPRKDASPRGSDEVLPTPHQHLYIPWKLNATAFVQGLAFGAGRMLVSYFGDNWLVYHSNMLYLSGYVAAAFLVVGFALVMRRKFDTLIYKIGCPLLAVGTLLMSVTPLIGAACVVSSLGYRLIDLLIWSLVPYLAVSKKVPIGWLLGWSTACLYAGVMTGYFLVDAMMLIADGSVRGIASSFIAFVVMLAALILTSPSNDAKAWGSLRPANSTLLQPYFDEAVSALAKEKGLTARQQQVFTLLCRGKTRKEIAADLVLSQETVKVHMRNVYREFDVHSQQELRSVVEAEEMRLSSQ